MKVQAISLSEVGILSRFSDMEKKFPRREGKNYFPSLDFYLNYFEDREGAIREEANKMIEFAGLGTYHSNVKFSVLDGAAGNIVLNNNMVADITIDEGVAKSIDAVMATLAHEICHKVLHKHGIYYKGFFDQENEVYADLATFYVGFGDLTMKGYKIDKRLMGYLTPETYAMAYVLMTLINKNVEYNIDSLPMHARVEIDKAKRICGLSKTNFKNLCQEDYNKLYSDSFYEIRKLYEFYDLLRAAIPAIQDSFSFLSKNLSDAFYNYDIKDLEWHKFSIAFNSYVFMRPDGENNIILSKLKEQFCPAFFNIFRLLKINNMLSKFTNIERHCPNCGCIVTKKLESREYHLVCPKCKTHFIIDGNLDKILEQASSFDEKMTKQECEAIIENSKLKEEIKKLTEEIESLKSIVDKNSINEDDNNKVDDVKEESSLLSRLQKKIWK